MTLAVFAPMEVPLTFDCGGGTPSDMRMYADTCVSYLNPSNIALVNNAR